VAAANRTHGKHERDAAGNQAAAAAPKSMARPIIEGVSLPRMRRAALVRGAAGLLLAGPNVLAFYSGGFFTSRGWIAAIVGVAVCSRLPSPGRPPLPLGAPAG